MGVARIFPLYLAPFFLPLAFFFLPPAAAPAVAPVEAPSSPGPAPAPDVAAAAVPSAPASPPSPRTAPAAASPPSASGAPAPVLVVIGPALRLLAYLRKSWRFSASKRFRYTLERVLKVRVCRPGRAGGARSVLVLWWDRQREGGRKYLFVVGDLDDEQADGVSPPDARPCLVERAICDRVSVHCEEPGEESRKRTGRSAVSQRAMHACANESHARYSILGRR